MISAYPTKKHDLSAEVFAGREFSICTTGILATDPCMCIAFLSTAHVHIPVAMSGFCLGKGFRIFWSFEARNLLFLNISGYKSVIPVYICYPNIPTFKIFNHYELRTTHSTHLKTTRKQPGNQSLYNINEDLYCYI